jgi:hypothetical protein
MRTFFFMPGRTLSLRLQFEELYFLKKNYSGLQRTALGLHIGPDKFTEEECLSIPETFSSPCCAGMFVHKECLGTGCH